MDSVADNQAAAEISPQPKILVVDDDVLNQRMMQVILTREGYKVDLASNGLEAFEAIKSNRYDLVFMDLQMPVMDGIEASRRIREWENGGRHTFIVALTASYLPEQGHILFEAGIDNYISKPFDLDHIQRLLRYSLAPRSAEADQPALLEQDPSKEILDIQKGIEQVGGDPETYKELLGDFIEGLPERLRLIQHSFKKMDMAGLSRAAHNLNGVAASLGASQLSEYARKLDMQSVDGYTDAIDDLLRDIQLTGSKLLETSNNFLAEKTVNAGSL
jgi:CheY-like chemotaxis protein/HPt (histidine-containing phosphotransfer) domain-containing protein